MIEVEGNAAVTKLWDCLSGETVGCMCKMGFGAELEPENLIEEIRNSVTGNLKKLSQRVELLKMGSCSRD